MLNWSTIEDKYKSTLGFTVKGVCTDWIYLSFCFRKSTMDKKKGGGGKGKRK